MPEHADLAAAFMTSASSFRSCQKRRRKGKLLTFAIPLRTFSAAWRVYYSLVTWRRNEALEFAAP